MSVVSLLVLVALLLGNAFFVAAEFALVVHPAPTRSSRGPRPGPPRAGQDAGRDPERQRR